jgi:hypothetical protein
MSCLFKKCPTKMAIRSPPKGKRILEDTLSKKSKKVKPNTFTELNKPELFADKAARIPNNKTIMAVIKTAVFLESFFSSVMKATTTSNIEIIAVVAAIAVKIKNIITSSPPKGILEKTNGIVINKSPGPCSGAIPKENTAGKIAIPASKDTIVSEIMTLPEVAIILLSLVK